MKTAIRLGNTTAMTLVLLGGIAAAQDFDDATMLGRVVLGYAEDGTPIYAGDNSTELDSHDLRAQGAGESLDDVLRQQTSVFTMENPTNPGIAVNVRGFEGSGRVDVSVDGVPQNFRTTGHAAQGYAYVDENLLSSIDITRGAVVGTGGNGIAGSVNFQTISPEDLVEDGDGFGSVFRYGYSSNGGVASGMVGTAYMSEQFDALFAVSGRDADDFEDGAGAVVSDTAEQANSELLKLAYHIDGSQTISFSAMNYNSEFISGDYEQDLTTSTYILGYSFDAADGLINLDVNAYYSEVDNQYGDTYLGSSPYGGGSVGRHMVTKTLGINATNISEFSLGAWDLTSINGFEYSRDDLAGGNSGVNPADGESVRAALFSENIFSNGPWEVTAGLRLNKYTLEGGVVDIDETSVDPSLTVAYQVNDWFQPYATISRASRTPSLQETMFGGTPHGGVSGGFVGNPELRPEVSTGYELGFNIQRDGLFTADDRLEGRVNYYQMDVENYITASYPDTVTTSAGTGYTFVNVPGISQTRGLEIELNYLVSRYEIGLSYTRNDSDMPGQTPGLGSWQFLPEETVSLRVAGNFYDDKLSVGAEYNYVSGGVFSGQYNMFPETRDSYDLVDIFAIYEPTENVTLSAKVSNLFDTAYEPWLNDGNNGPGRNVYVGAEIRF